MTTSADHGPGSLREALASIDASSTNYGWTIRLSPALAGQTISLSNSAANFFGPSALLISNTVLIDGSAAPGARLALDVSSAPMRLFFVSSGAQLTLQNLALQNGFAQGGQASAVSGGGGGGAGLGGAIYNQGTVTLNNVLLSSNQAVGGAGGAWASGAPGSGGIPSGGAGGSGATGYGGGAGGSSTCGGAGGNGAGGAIYNDGGFVNMNNCVVLGNLARGGLGGSGQAGCNGANAIGLGAGVFNYNGTSRLSGCLFTNNSADLGAGIANLGDGIASWVYLTQDILTNVGSASDFVSLNTNGGDAQTVEFAGAFDSQYALWISPIFDVGTIHTNQPVSVPVVLHPPGALTGPFPLAALSSNTNLVPGTNLSFTGSGTNFTLTVTPASNRLGATFITVSAEGQGFSAAATFTAYFGLFGNVSVSGSNRVLTVAADAGLHCFVEYTTNLFNPGWVSLGQAVESPPGFYQLLDIGPTDPVRYYRISIH